MPPQNIRQLKKYWMDPDASRSYRDESCKLPNMPDGLVSGLWRDNHLERQMAPNGDVKDQALINAVQVNKAVTAITRAPIKD